MACVLRLRPGAVMLLAAALLVGCRREAAPPPTWRADCPPVAGPAAVSLEGARQAHRDAARRHELRLREAAVPGTFLRAAAAALDPERLAAGEICLAEIARHGELLFEHEYGYLDGLGTGDGRPAGPFRRVHDGVAGGPETVSCASCHWVGGPNGAGAETDNVFLSGDGDRPGSADARNPPALAGLGVVQALAAEMSRELQRQRDALVRRAAREGATLDVRLTAKGIDFGLLRADADGAVDTSGVRGVDPDLVIKPFGWKGNFRDVAELAADALHVHMTVAAPAGAAEAELAPGSFTALVAHLSVLEMPIVQPLVQDLVLPPAAAGLRAPTTTNFADDFQRGRGQFHALGCAGCHVPMLVLEDPTAVVEGLPAIDLARQMRQPGLRADAGTGGYPVWLFSDLKRHDMGPGNAARHVQRGVAAREYLTPRLWGVADSPPYLHDGRAPSFDYAIAGHDGEGAAARDAFAALPPPDKAALRVYLMSLRRAPRLFVP